MSQAVIVDRGVLEGEPIRAVSWLETLAGWDSGFALFAGEPNEQSETALVCFECIIDEHPELGAAMVTAKQHGEAIL